MSETEVLIAELERRIAERQVRIDTLSYLIDSAKQRLPYLSVVSRYIQRQVIDSHARAITSLKGWQTRDLKSLEKLKAPPPPPPPPIPPEERISDEECSGYDIFINTETKKYVVRDPDTKALIRQEEKICMEITASITTHEGHDVPVVVEITATTYVKEMSLSDLIKAEDEVNDELIAYLVEKEWGNLVKGFEKIGVAYNGENHIDEKGWYTWQVPDYPKVHVFIEKKQPTMRSYEGEFTA